MFPLLWVFDHLLNTPEKVIIWPDTKMNWLEKKIPPLILMIIIAGIMALLPPYLPTADFDETSSALLGSAMIAIGLFMIAAGVIEFLKNKTTVDPRQPEKASKMVTSGIYRFSRNPMYLGFALFLFAITIFLQSPFLLLGVVVFIAYMNRFQIKPEEQAMTDRFGEQYLKYVSRVRRWL